MSAFARSLLLAIALAGCHDHRGASSPGGPLASCPGGLASTQWIALKGGAPGNDVSVTTSADALKEAAESFIAPQASARDSEGYDPGEPPANEAGLLDAFVRETDFAANDVAVVRAGAERNHLVGVQVEAASTRIFFSPSCAPCGGGNPGSYYRAKAQYDASVDPWTALVRVKKGTSVSAETCSAGACGKCRNDVP